MKKLLFIALLFVTSLASAQLTLSEKATLSEQASFRARIYQSLYSKANYFRTQSNPANLEQQKQQNYAIFFLKGGGNSIDIYNATRFWLANYNGVQILDSNGQPIDSEILNSQGLDIVYNLLAGVVTGDSSLPVE